MRAARGWCPQAPGLTRHPLCLPEIQENAINPSDMRRAQEEVLHSRHAELKDRLRRISQGYDRLRKVSHQGYGAEAGELGRGQGGAGSPQALLPHVHLGSSVPFL